MQCKCAALQEPQSELSRPGTAPAVRRPARSGLAALQRKAPLHNSTRLGPSSLTPHGRQNYFSGYCNTGQAAPQG